MTSRALAWRTMTAEPARAGLAIAGVAVIGALLFDMLLLSHWPGENAAWNYNRRQPFGDDTAAGLYYSPAPLEPGRSRSLKLSLRSIEGASAGALLPQPRRGARTGPCAAAAAPL